MRMKDLFQFQGCGADLAETIKTALSEKRTDIRVHFRGLGVLRKLVVAARIQAC